MIICYTPRIDQILYGISILFQRRVMINNTCSRTYCVERPNYALIANTFRAIETDAQKRSCRSLVAQRDFPNHVFGRRRPRQFKARSVRRPTQNAKSLNARARAPAEKANSRDDKLVRWCVKNFYFQTDQSIWYGPMSGSHLIRSNCF